MKGLSINNIAVFLLTALGFLFVATAHSDPQSDPAENLITVDTKIGFPLTVDKRDGIVAQYIISTGTWEPEVTTVLRKLVKPGDTIVEVGGNYGYHTVFLSKLIGEKGKIYTYEANDEVCELLQKNIQLTKTGANTDMRCIGVSDKVGQVKFLSGYSNLGGSFVVGENFDPKANSHVLNNWHEKTVNTTYLDKDLKNLKNVALLRMDAEGSELLIIRGAKKLITDSKDLKIMMEWDVAMLSNFGDVKQMLTDLESMNFKFYLINKDATLALKTKDELLGIGHSDIVMARENLNQ